VPHSTNNLYLIQHDPIITATHNYNNYNNINENKSKNNN